MSNEKDYVIDRPIDSLAPQLERGYQSLVIEYNKSAAPYPADKTIVELFEAQVERTPEDEAIHSGDQGLTYRELNDRANQMAVKLRTLGTDADQLVALYMGNSIEVVCSMLGVLKAGAAYVPIDINTPKERLVFILQDIAKGLAGTMPVLVTQSSFARDLPDGIARVITLDADFASIGQYPVTNPRFPVSPNNLAYVIYTSGSTGTPKGVMIEHRSLVNYIWWANEKYCRGERLTWPLFSSLAFDLTVTSIFTPLISGGHIVVYHEDPGVHGTVIFKVIEDNVADIVKLTPAHLAMIKGMVSSATKIRKFIVGGEDFKTELASDITRNAGYPVEIYNEYGPTEATVGCMIHRYDRENDLAPSVPIGNPAANTCIFILDENLNPVPIGDIGEMCIAGDGLARGYVNRPELTEEKFVTAKDPRQNLPAAKSSVIGSALLRLYKTGDLARWNAKGSMEFLGRVDNQVKVGGVRIELGEIEARLLKHADVRECVVDVVGWDSKQMADSAEPSKTGEMSINRLVAYYVSEKSLNAAELRAHLAQELPAYMLPPYFIRLDRLPLTSNGKIDRKSLPAPTSDNLAASHDFVRPHTETEKALAAIWTELLKVENIGINDSFFDLGGHSLLAIKAISRIRDVFGVDLEIETLFENPTITDVSKALTKAKGGSIQEIGQRKQSGPCSLSFTQEPLWFLDQLSPGSPVYNLVDVIRIGGEYDAETMRRAMMELVRRHEVLRTAFSHNEGQPMQVVLPMIDLTLSELDLRSLPEQEQEREWLRVVHEEGRKPFDLSQAPLFRGTMVHLTNQEHRLLLTIHHIIADEWSMEIIHQEVNQLFEAFSQNQPSPLSELPIQYADFACWQRNWLQGEVLQRQVSYWKEELAGAPFILELPTDKQRPAVQSFRGSTEIFELSKELLERIKSLGRRENATLFMILEASFMALLHRYTGQGDILVGTPITGRTHRETERMIGYFLNTVVLRAKFNDGLDFRSLLQQVRERAIGAYAHADLPFGHLVSEMTPERDPSRTPLFQVMFVVHNPDGVSEVSKVSGNRTLETGTSKFDLTLLLSETGNHLEGLIEYSTDLFEAHTIQRLCKHYEKLLEAIVSDPDQSISMLPMLTEAERQQLLVNWNDTTVAYRGKDLCLHQLIEEQGLRIPDQVALVFEQQTLTYGELNDRANQLAQHLRGLGVGPDILVGLFMDRSLEMVIALLGILKAGGAYLPLDRMFPRERLAFMLADAKPPVLVTLKKLLDETPPHQAKVICVDALPETVAPQAAADRPSSSNLAYVLYTSGSTGNPKGVEISHRAVVNFLNSMRRSPGMDEHDTLLSVTTISFDILGLELWLPLTTGAKVVIVPQEVVMDGKQLAMAMTRSRATVMQATPTTWRLLLESGWEGNPRLKILCGGEAWSQELARPLLSKCASLWNMYGPTETTIWSAVSQVKEGESVSIGQPIANTQFYVVDKHLQLLPIGVPGELLIGGDGLARGYLNRPELTVQKFIPDLFSKIAGTRLYRTGDLVRYLPDGKLEYLVRLDNQVKIRGFRIEIGEIETVLGGHEAVRHVVVIAREDTPGDKQLAAYIIPNANRNLSISELRQYLREQLPEYMVPSSFTMMEKFPLTLNGKIDRRSLSAPASHRPELESVYMAPGSEIERTIAAIWQEVLHLEKTGVNDNFFDLGGNSLRMAQVHGRLCNKLERNVSMLDMFKYPTINSLSHYLSVGGSEQIPSNKNDDRAEKLKEGKNRLHQRIRQREQAGLMEGSLQDE